MTRVAATILIIGFAFFSCATGEKVSLHDSVVEDTDYSGAYDKATRGAEVYKDFESRFRVTATYLSPEFRSAFTQRLKELFTQEHPSLEEANSKAGFFISIQAPDDKAVNLSDTHLWTVFLENGASRLNPVLVRRINDKLRWSPFFQKVSKWTHEYLILFDTPSITPSNEELVEKQNFKLTLTNADAKVRFSW